VFHTSVKTNNMSSILICRAHTDCTLLWWH